MAVPGFQTESSTGHTRMTISVTTILGVLICFVNSLPYRHKHQHREKLDDLYPELGRFFEGDILLNPRRNAILDSQYKWPEATVPYVFHPTYTETEKKKVLDAMAGIENATCVKFIRQTDQEDYIEIGKKKHLGCVATVGYQKGLKRPQMVNLQSPECLRHRGTIQHELLHVLGLLHEQSRSDRDNYVTIYWDNIEKEYWPDFRKVDGPYVSTYNISYDYKSLMHYPKYAFSKNGEDTIQAKNDSKLELGQRVGPTAGDLEKIRKIYNCSSGLIGNEYGQVFNVTESPSSSTESEKSYSVTEPSNTSEYY